MHRKKNSLQSPDIGQNSCGGISDFRIYGQSFIKENCNNSLNSNDIDMKLGPVTKLYKRNMATSKKLTMASPCQKIVKLLSFSRFMANLEQSGNRIPDAWSVDLKFSSTVTFYLTKTERRTKKSLTQLSYYYFE